LKLVITIKFEDKTKRLLEAVLDNMDTATSLADELVSFGLVSEVLDEKDIAYFLSIVLFDVVF
jgi:hypothetical protein